MLFASAGLLWNSLAWLIGQGVPLLRRRGGALTWMLVLIGWVLGVVLYSGVDWEALRQGHGWRTP